MPEFQDTATIPLQTLLYIVTLAVTNPNYNANDGVKIDSVLQAIFTGR
jgi:hypothetical protein